MIEYILIPIAAICNRWRGGGVYRFEWEKRLEELEVKLKASAVTSGLSPDEWDEYEKLKTRSKWLARKLVSGVVLAIICALFAKNIWVAPIILSGWYARNVVGTGFLFNAIHGWYAPKWKGIVYGTARGLLTLATTIPLAALFYFTGQNSNINSCILLSLLGLFGALQGVIYYAAGKLSKNHAVTVAELIDGALYGGILCLI